MILESVFQKKVIDEIMQRYPGAVVLKNDPNYLSGIPDLLVLEKDRWAALECKRDKNSTTGPNQSYYVNKLNNMSFASFIYPQCMEEVLDELQQSFGY